MDVQEGLNSETYSVILLKRLLFPVSLLSLVWLLLFRKTGFQGKKDLIKLKRCVSMGSSEREKTLKDVGGKGHYNLKNLVSCHKSECCIPSQ